MNFRWLWSLALIVLMGAAPINMREAQAAPLSGCQLDIDSSRARNLASWKAGMAEYSKRHYGEATWELEPQAIVMHYTVSRGFPWNLVNTQSFGGEKPGLGVHYIVEGSKVWQILPPHVRSRGAYGINHRAINIEMVAMTAEELARKPHTLPTAARLVSCLMKQYNIPREKVYAHSDVAKMDTQIIPEVLDLVDDRPYGRTDPGAQNMKRLLEMLVDIQKSEVPKPEAQAAATRAPVVQKLSLARATSWQGRPLEAYRLGQGQDEFVFFFGGFHGDEAQGVLMLNALMAELKEKPALLEKRSVFIMPQVNPDGVAHKKRVNHRGVDLNRNFPTSNYRAGAHPKTRYYAGQSALSEPESKAVFELLKPFVERIPAHKIKIMSIHAPLAVNNYDGPARDISLAMKRHNGYAVSSDIGYPTPGSFGSYYGKEKGIRVVTLETGRVSAQAAWKRHRKALYAFLLFPADLDDSLR